VEKFHVILPISIGFTEHWYNGVVIEVEEVGESGVGRGIVVERGDVV
jgi:hypothetical protein